jgi:hypothetical protein
MPETGEPVPLMQLDGETVFVDGVPESEVPLPEFGDVDDDDENVDFPEENLQIPVQEEEFMPDEAVAAPVSAEPSVDATYRVRMPASQVNLGVLRPTTPSIPGVGTSASYAATVENLRTLSEDATAAGFRVVIRRRSPATFNGFRLPVGIIEEMEPMPFDDVQARVAELHGGGTYNLQIITPTGQMVRQMLFRVDENVHEPKVPANAPMVNVLQPSEYGRMMARPNLGASGLGTHTPEDQILIDLRKQEQVLQATKMKEDREHEIEKSRRRRKAEDEADRDAEERKKMLPEIAEANRRVDSLKDEIRHVADSFKDSLSSLREVLTHRGDDSGVKVLLETMKTANEQQRHASEQHAAQLAQQSKQQMDLLIALITSKKGEPDGVIEAIKMSMESQKQTTQMIVESAKNENNVMRDLFMNVVTQRLAAPDDQVKLHQQAEDRGWSKAMELTRLLEEARAGAADDSLEIDPEGGFWGNLSNIALQGLQRAVRGASNGGGLRGALQGVLSPGAAYPAPEAPVVYRTPAPAPVQRLPAPAPVMAAPNPGGSPLFEGMVQTEVTEGVAPALPAPVSGPAAVAAQVAPVVPETTESEEDDLRMHVTEAMRMALDDFKVGRKVHDWSDHAIDKWHRQFKIELARAVDDAARIQMIGAKCEPAVFEQVITRIRSGGQDVFYFTQAIQAIVQDAAREFAA